MSLFGSLMGDFEDDPFFGAHMRSMRQMNNVMNSMFANPFGFMGAMGPGGMGPGGMGPPAIAGPTIGGSRETQDMMPFGFPSMNMNRIFADFPPVPCNPQLPVQCNPQDQVSNNPNCHSFSSSTVMTMSSGPDGRPQVYQASSSTRSAPGGIKETKKSVCDSRSGVKKLAVGHHIGERSHVLEREQNIHSGDREERQEFINLDEEEAEDFNREFEQKAKQTLGAIAYQSSRHGRRQPHLALPSSSSTTATSPIVSSTSPQQQQQERSRKRDHEPDVERIHKALKPSHETSM